MREGKLCPGSHLFSFIVQLLSCFRLFATLWTVAFLIPREGSIGSIGFSRQEYWSGLPFASPGNLPVPGIKPASPVSPALAGQFFTTSTTYGNAMESLSLQSLVKQCHLAPKISAVGEQINAKYKSTICVFCINF